MSAVAGRPLVTTTTSRPRSTRARVTYPPMNPRPPVTTMASNWRSAALGRLQNGACGRLVGHQNVHAARPERAQDRVPLLEAGSHRHDQRDLLELVPFDGDQTIVEHVDRLSLGREEAGAHVPDRTGGEQPLPVLRRDVPIADERRAFVQGADADEREVSRGRQLERGSDRTVTEHRILD